MSSASTTSPRATLPASRPMPSRWPDCAARGRANCAMLEDILDGLFHIAKADGVLHEHEGQFLHRIAEIFHIEESHYQSILARHANLGDADPYLILGVERGQPVRRGQEALPQAGGGKPPRQADRARRAAGIHPHRDDPHRRDQRRLRDDRTGLAADMSGFAPDHPGADVRVSPNFGPRIGVAGPDMIVLHYTGMETGTAAEAWLCNPESEVSSHYLVHEDGRVVQMVRECDRAWHAGKSFWQGDDRHQFVLDRHRDRQSRPCARLPELSEAPDRSGHRPVPRHRRPACSAGGAGAGAFGRGAGAQGRSRRTVSVAASGRGGHRSYCRAATSRRHPGSGTRRQGRGGRGTAVDAVALRLRRRDHRRVRRSDRRCGCSVSAAFPAAHGSTAWPIDRRSRRCAGCSRRCLPARTDGASRHDCKSTMVTFCHPT